MTEPPTGTKAIEATVERVLFRSETGWSVLQLGNAGDRRGAKAVGPLGTVQPGERVRLFGGWVEDPIHGRQFRAEGYVPIVPTTPEGIERYLASGAVEGIGEVIARRIVARFGTRTLSVLEDEPDRLLEVEGIGRIRHQRITGSWSERRASREVLVFLHTHRLSPGLAGRILESYGAEAVERLRSDPYRLAREIRGIGFRTADGIASRLGMAPTALPRVRAALLHCLEQASERGHLFLPRAHLAREVAELLDRPDAPFDEAVDGLGADGSLRIAPLASESAVYLTPLFVAETTIAERVDERLGPTPPLVAAPGEALERTEQRLGLELAPAQREAVRRALTEAILVITGGPGTGKTTLVRALVEILRRAALPFALAAPTGRAARRLGEATGAEALTVHRLLEIDARSGRFQRHRERPLEADLVVVDEVSMLDAPLAAALFDAVSPSSRIVLVGDADQLPSVGPGNVLAELVASGPVPVVRLAEVFRQARRSLIVTNAHRIRTGRELRLVDRPDVDFFFVERESPEQILETLLHIATERIPASFGLDPLDDVQVLTPMRRGPLGTLNLNLELQRRLNPAASRSSAAERRLATGDKVMQLKNDYDRDVANGDTGRVVRVDAPTATTDVRFDRRIVRYERQALDQLTLAYACTVHKAQGSEYPAVVAPLHMQHAVLLRRNLLYTAVTRGRRLVVLVGSRTALAYAIRRSGDARRWTRLASLVRSPPPPEHR